MRIQHTALYKYDELSADAQSKARDWLREANQDDNYFAEYITEEFAALLAALGFEVRKAPGRNAPAIYWSGFSSQGDGAAFVASWRAERCKPSAWLDDRPVTYRKRDKLGRPNGKPIVSECNKRWHDVAAPIIALAKEFPSASASVTNPGRYFHMALGDTYDFLALDSDTEYTAEVWAEHDAANDAAGELFITAARDLAHTFWCELEKEYEYQNSDAQIAKSLIANEYEFTIEGNLA